MMRDGKALQMATSHELGQNFSRAFDIGFSDKDGNRNLCWTTSWGSSTRMIGGLIMCHGDDAGLRLPPVVAPVQAVVIAVKDDGRSVDATHAAVSQLADAEVRARADARVSIGFGRRVTEWELKGVPLRVEIGPRDLANGETTVIRRDSGDRATVPLSGLTAFVQETLPKIQRALADEAAARTQANIHDVSTIEEALEAAATGFGRLPWSSLGAQGERRLNAEAVSVRCLQTSDGGIPDDPDGDDLVAIVGRSY